MLKPYITAIWDYDDLLDGDDLALSILPDTASYLCFLYADLLTTRFFAHHFNGTARILGKIYLVFGG